MIVPPVGEVRPDPEDPDRWVSEPFPVPAFGGVPLAFAFEFLPEAGPAGRRRMRAAAAAFLAAGPDLKAAATPFVAAYREDVVRFVQAIGERDGRGGPQAARFYLRGYDLAAKVWSQVSWHETGIEGCGRRAEARVEDYADLRAAFVTVDCFCDWEEEHGLGIAFRDGTTLTAVGPGDLDVAPESGRIYTSIGPD